MTLSEYLDYQQNDAVYAFNNNGKFPVGVLSPQHFPSCLKNNTKIEYDLRVRKNRAFIRTYDNKVEYWVHISHLGYRESFLNFLVKHYYLDKKVITADWNADHILNKAYAEKFGVKYVRMCLLCKDQNQSYGRKFEKNMMKMNQNKRNIFLMDFLCAMKVLGVPIPENRNDYIIKKSNIVKSLEQMGVDFKGGIGEEELDEYFKWWSIL